MSSHEAKLEKLLDLLWTQYKLDCPYAAKVEELYGAENIRNDHIAFRGVHDNEDLKHMFNRLGYIKYDDIIIDRGEKKNITACIYKHCKKPTKFPKLFISRYHYYSIDDKSACHKARIIFDKCFGELEEYLEEPDEIFDYINTNKYIGIPKINDISLLQNIDQYLAWVRLFDTKPNHFTLSVNHLKHTVDPHMDIERVSARMKVAHIPMKDTIEGVGSNLAQTSTKAFDHKVKMLEQDGTVLLQDWPYAYYEIAERGLVEFDGFVPSQTTGLFDMTKKDTNNEK